MKHCLLNIIQVISSKLYWSALVIILYCKKLAGHIVNILSWVLIEDQHNPKYRDM